MKGLVVHAVKGERERYQPVESILDASADPAEMAICLQAETRCRALYIADLDAIQGKGDNKKAIERIASQLDAELWVDAGVADAEAASRLFSTGTDVVIIGSETLRELDQLRRIRDVAAKEKFIFSLDMVRRRLLSQAEPLKNMDPLSALECLTREGLDRFILLTLDAVGVGDGPDLSLLQGAKHRFPDHTIIAGGGVRTPDHLHALSAIGISGVLVATSLHKGWITGRDISALQ